MVTSLHKEAVVVGLRGHKEATVPGHIPVHAFILLYPFTIHGPVGRIRVGEAKSFLQGFKVAGFLVPALTDPASVA